MPGYISNQLPSLSPTVVFIKVAPHSRSSKKKDGCLFISLTVIVWVAESH